LPIKEITQNKNLPLEFTYHAQKRIQQRGLTKEIVQFIFDNGLKTNSHQDKRYIFNVKKQKQKNRELLLDPFFKKFQKQIENTALIVHGRVLVTAYRIDGRIWR